MWGTPPKLDVTPQDGTENVTPARDAVVVVVVVKVVLGEKVGGPMVRRERVDSSPEILILS